MKIVSLSYELTGLEDEYEVLMVNPHTIQQNSLEVEIQKIKDFSPDLMIEREFNDGVALYDNLYKALPKVTKAWWNIDQHTTYALHTSYANYFDYVFCAQSWFIPGVTWETTARVFYLPLSFTKPASYLTQDEAEKTITLSFIGNIRSFHKKRASYVEALLMKYPDMRAEIIMDFEEMFKTLQASKATFNCSLANDLNFRVFEALASGTNVITDYLTDIYMIEGLAERLFIYERTSEEEMFEAVEKALLTDTNSTDFIRSFHCLNHRYSQMLEMINSNTQKEYV